MEPFPRQRLDKAVEQAWRAFEDVKGFEWRVSPAIPILFFGDSGAYWRSGPRVLTVGLNPSLHEFPDMESSRRHGTADSRGCRRPLPGSARPNAILILLAFGCASASSTSRAALLFGCCPRASANRAVLPATRSVPYSLNLCTAGESTSNPKAAWRQVREGDPAGFLRSGGLAGGASSRGVAPHRREPAADPASPSPNRLSSVGLNTPAPGSGERSAESPFGRSRPGATSWRGRFDRTPRR